MKSLPVQLFGEAIPLNVLPERYIFSMGQATVMRSGVNFGREKDEYLMNKMCMLFGLKLNLWMGHHKTPKQDVNMLSRSLSQRRSSFVNNRKLM